MAQRKRQLPVFWILSATALVTLIASLPLIFSLSQLGVKDFSRISSFVPHQFIFITSVFPFAVFATFTGAAIILLNTEKFDSFHPMLAWLQKNWQVLAMLGIAFSSIVAIVDFYFTPKSFEKYRSAYVSEIIDCADSKSRISPSIINGNDTQPAITTPPILLKGNDACVFTSESLSVDFQKEKDVVHPVTHFLAQIQLIVVLSIGFFLFILSLVFILANTVAGDLLRPARPAILVAITLFAFYPLLFAIWRNEALSFTSQNFDNFSHVIVLGVIIILLFFIVFTDKELHAPAMAFGALSPILVVILTFFTLQSAGMHYLGSIFGSAANLSTRVNLFIAMWMVGLLLAAFLVVQFESKEA